MTRPSDTPQSELSAQEKSTVEAIVGARSDSMSFSTFFLLLHPKYLMNDSFPPF